MNTQSELDICHDVSQERLPGAILAPTSRDPVENEHLHTMGVPESMRGLFTLVFDGKTSPRRAIRAMCYQCVGYVRGEVEGCCGRSCPLYAYRPIPKRKK